MEKLKKLNWKIIIPILVAIIVVLVVVIISSGGSKRETETTLNVEAEVKRKIESYVTTSLSLNASISTKANCYSVVIKGDTATVYGNYSAIGSSTKLGTFEGTCKVEVSNNNVYVSNEKIDITKP